MDAITLSPKLQLALTLFVVGLVLLGLAVLGALLVLRHRRNDRAEDYAVKLLRNSAVPFGLQIFVRAIDFAFITLLYHLFVRQQEALANYQFAAFITTLLLATVAEWGLNIHLTREVARDPSAMQRTFGTALGVRLGLAALVVPASVLVVLLFNGLQSAGLIDNGFDRQGLWLMVLLGCTTLPDAFSGAVSALFLATERPIVPAVVGVLTNILSALLKIGALLVGWGIVGVAWAALLATVGNALIFGTLLVQYFGWPALRFEREEALSMLRAGFPLMLNALLLAVFFRFDTTIIRAFCNAAEYNAYDAAYKYVGLTQILPPIVINAVFPLFARKAATDRVALRRAYEHLTRLLLLLALPIAAAMSILAPWFISIFGAEYVALGAPALTILIWYLPLSYINGVTQYVLIAVDRPKTITVAFGAAALFNFLFNLALVPIYGIPAAALATVLSEVVLYVPLHRALHREIEPAPLWQTAWRPALAAAGMIIGMALLARIHVVVSIVVGPLLFWGGLLAVGAIQEEDRHLARRMLRRV